MQEKNIANENEKKYVEKIIPDLGFISYFEKAFWTNQEKVNSYNKDEYYEDIFYCIAKAQDPSVSIDLKSYRCVIASENELDFSSANDSDTFIYQMPNYSGRYIYVGFSSDMDKFKQSIHCKIKKLDYPDEYIFVMRF